MFLQQELRLKISKNSDDIFADRYEFPLWAEFSWEKQLSSLKKSPALLTVAKFTLFSHQNPGLEKADGFKL